MELLYELHHGLYIEASTETVARYLRRWLESHDSSVRRSTVASYRQVIERYAIPRIGSLQLSKLQTTDLNTLYRDLHANGSRNGGPLNAKTVANVHVVLRRALNDAVRWGVLQRNPAQYATRPRVTHTPRATWSAEQVRQFIETVGTEPLASAWLLLATTGMRRGEVLGLRWKDVDWASSYVTVNQQLTTVNNKPLVEAPKTAAGRRSIALPPAVLEGLRQRRRLQSEDQLVMGPGWQNTRGLVFTHPDGTWVHPDTFSRQFQRHLKTAGLPRIRLHDLRHTWATLALQNDIHLKVVSDHLGHSTIAITADLYSHVVPSVAAHAMETVTRTILG